MARPFDFLPNVKMTAFQRQWNLCAHCGECLEDDWDNAHHVVPNQSGVPGRAADQFLRSADNCVILCGTCHYAVHDSGRYRTGAVPPPGYYSYSHGKHSVQHRKWVLQLEQLIRDKY